MATEAANKLEPKQVVVFDDEVLEKIAGKTASEIDGILGLQGNVFENLSSRLTTSDNPEKGVTIDLDAEQKQVMIEMAVILEYGKKADDILDRLTNKVTSAVKLMTGYQVTEVKLDVKDMLTREEWQQKNSDKSKKKSKEHD